ncbi:ribosome biogenesis GTPase YlqF [Ruminococcus sp. CAG:330]|uniref:ribosome biogenesis GTPase YlqF n=1 Tax=Ruminococcus sp. CAG:330 TaxID=1262954 RepID=UPI00033B792D|nr:ribosome biogenesis GTPase YlqF [Ruminococcus sp. CAG:330]CDE13570.1 ribosome biogenesis GTPase A [Ruminococcus sp. CAG:330]
MAEELMQNIQWFPGHMTKTRRMIAANLSLVDAVVEILDARIPRSSRNPEMDRMVGTKPRLLLLNKADMADPAATSRWIQAYRKENRVTLAVDCRSGKGISGFAPAVRQQLLRELLEKRQAHGMSGAPIRLMVVGIPNVGKSSFINRMAQSKRAKVEDRPGVTRTKQWVKIGNQMELLDMPGVLWPNFEDQTVARRLAFTGAINDDIMDLEALAGLLLCYLAKAYPQVLEQRYKMTGLDEVAEDGYAMLELLGRKRGMLISGGEVNLERAAITLLDEFRSGKLGRITLELPEEA